jgi:hypothetical protein
VPALTWLYIAMAQFPVYLLPHGLKAVLTRYGEAQTPQHAEPPRYDSGSEL